MKKFQVFSQLRRFLLSPLGRPLVSDAASLTSVQSSSDGSEKLSTLGELYHLPPSVTENLDRQGLVYPTEIQKKVLGFEVLHVV